MKKSNRRGSEWTRERGAPAPYGATHVLGFLNIIKFDVAKIFIKFYIYNAHKPQ